MQLGDLPNTTILFVIIGVLIAISAYAMSQIQTGVTCTANTTFSQCGSGLANASACCIEFPNVPLATARTAQYSASNATGSMGTLAQWAPTIAIVIAAALIIALVLGSLVFKRQ